MINFIIEFLELVWTFICDAAFMLLMMLVMRIVWIGLEVLYYWWKDEEIDIRDL